MTYHILIDTCFGVEINNYAIHTGNKDQHILNEAY